MSENTAIAYPTNSELLLRYLQRERDNLVGTLDGLSEYDARRPMTPTGTSLLGLVKHVATVEIGYLGECVGRPWPEPIPWANDEAYEAGLDMYAAADEPLEMILDLYRRSWAHADESVRTLGLDAPASVSWWPEERRVTTLGYLLVHLLAETAHQPATPTSCGRPSTAAPATTTTSSATRSSGAPTWRGSRPLPTRTGPDASAPGG